MINLTLCSLCFYGVKQQIYWCGPILGALVAAILYEFIFDIKRRTNNNASYLSSSLVGGAGAGGPGAVLSSSSLSALTQLQTPLSFGHHQPMHAQQQQQYLQHQYQTQFTSGAGRTLSGKFFHQD